MRKIRLDLLLVERGLAESRSLAQRLVMAGQVRVNGEMVLRAATTVTPDVRLEVEHGPRFVSRGGDKLEAALQTFDVDISGHTCADVGASTGGFTDCLIQHGAIKVYAIDVGQGILDWKLRQDSRVTVMEKTNARYLERLPQAVEIITIDVSFISLKVLLPVVKNWYSPAANIGQVSMGSMIALIKPQFEAGRQQVGRGKGVIRDPSIHRQVLLDILKYARLQGYVVRGLIRSPLTGPKGNAEFLTWLECAGEQIISIEVLVDAVLPAADRGSEPTGLAPAS
jgi:23S rRNA (cytidine1920-2'-O)/16S rRNA (cytidine1409-2'-O)-methyltransferase